MAVPGMRTLLNQLPLLISCYSFDLAIKRMAWAVRDHTGVTGPEMHPKPGGLLRTQVGAGVAEVAVSQNTPFRMCRVDDKVYVCDVFLAEIRVYRVRGSELLYDYSIQHRLFNDLHAIEFDTVGEKFYVVSSGVDAILVFDNEFVLERVIDLAKIVTGRSVIEDKLDDYDFSTIESIPTHLQITHVNAVAVDENGVRCSLFHQGEIIRLHGDDTYSVLASGLLHPHGSVKFGNSYYVVDSEHYRISVCDNNWNEVGEFRFDGWVQAARVLRAGGQDYLAVIETDNSRIYLYNNRLEEVETLDFPANYRLVDIMALA